MIDNSNNIGLIPDYILEQVGNLRPGELNISNKIKRRRSGSLTSNYIFYLDCNIFII